MIIFSYLNGGLGNQMFQYATARALAMRHGAELVLDGWSGFVRDFQYRRRYELSALPIQARIASPLERLPIWFYRLQHYLAGETRSIIEKHWYGQFLNETELAYQPQLAKINITGATWLVGYWQSPRYFHHYAPQIRAELMPPPARQQKFLTLARQIRQTESVALGIRLYEESNDPLNHARDRRAKTVKDIRKAMDQLLSYRQNARFFVFCTHRSPLIDQLGLPANSVIVTQDDGYEGNIETLWLLAQCRHHIMTNSSYYWWGAWLSAAVRGCEGQCIFAANNFVNRDGLCPEWETF